MQGNRIRFAAGLFAIASLLGGCATTSAPDGWLPDAEQAEREAWGGWVEVTYNVSGSLTDAAGELIAVDPASMYVLSDSGLHQIPFTEINEASLMGYNIREGALVAWMFTGMLSSLTHGIGVLVSIPVWGMVGGLTTGATSRVPVISYPDHPLLSFRLYARFPQGLPPGIDPLALKRKPFLLE